MKYTRFRDIPQFTRCGNYQVNVDWGYLEHHLAGWDEPKMGSPLVLDRYGKLHPAHDRQANLPRSCQAPLRQDARPALAQVRQEMGGTKLLTFTCLLVSLNCPQKSVDLSNLQ